MTQQLTELRVSVGGIEHQRRAIESQREPLRPACATCTSAWRFAPAKSQLQSEDRRVPVEIRESEEIARARRRREKRSSISAASSIAWRVPRHRTGEEELRTAKQANDAQAQKSGFEVQLAQKRMESQNSRTRLAEVPGECRGCPRRPDQYHGGRPDSCHHEQVEMPVDWDALELQVTELQSKLDAMGPVNVKPSMSLRNWSSATISCRNSTRTSSRRRTSSCRSSPRST